MSERTIEHGAGTSLRFSAVVGQEVAKQALLMAAAQPRLGGVLLRGDKGSAKTTLARGLAAVMPGGAPFVELPLGATEERVIGSVDLAELLVNGAPRVRPGLLAAAHGGVLYVDEINLLADHLVDALLDVAVSGVNRIERDGVSHVHPARFVLVASMNPEEGELRPQLLDRFGLAVDIAGLTAVADRTEAVRRQLGRERVEVDDPFRAADDVLRGRIAAARAADVEIGDEVIEVASRLALEVGAEGLRADLMLCRAASARAALDARRAATVDDVRAVAELVLGHRRRRRPFDEPGIAPDELDDAWQRATAPVDAAAPDDGADRAAAGGEPDSEPGGGPSDRASDDRLDAAGPPAASTLPAPPRPARPAAPRQPGGSGAGAAARERFVREQPFGTAGSDSIDGRATAVALATRRGVDATPGAPLSVADLTSVQREQRTASLIVFVVDASGSMGVERRMAATKSAVLGLLADAYRRRGKVALVTFRGESAEVVLRPTASVEIARARLAELRTGGTTPIAAGLDAAASIVGGATGDRIAGPTVVIVTDGRATGAGPDPSAVALVSMSRLAATGAHLVVLDTESGIPRLGLAAELAASVGATCVRVAGDVDRLEELVRAL